MATTKSTKKHAAKKAGKKKTIKKKVEKKPVLTARNSDKQILYQLSVQNVEHEEEFVTNTFERVRGRKPRTLREDFCGTALACAQFVRAHPNRQAVGLDLCAETLAWAKEHNIAPLGPDADKVLLLQKNVVSVTKRKFDVCCAMNFSYFIFKTRPELVHYFDCVRKSLNEEGIFVLDCYGGSDAQVVLQEKRKVQGFTYVWDQARYNPIDSNVVNHIHFEFKKGPRMEKAFSYDWRLWTPIEITEALHEVGFKHVEVCWEIDDEDGEGTGEYVPRRSVENQPGWIAYIVAIR
ncbi:MAG: class I SAM-dependent methyltransferase [Planctomycetes bacterium]|nr:class I SAM-dependent methyltransferase [Planctomycetota bacterium]